MISKNSDYDLQNKIWKIYNLIAEIVKLNNLSERQEYFVSNNKLEINYVLIEDPSKK